MFIDTNYFHQPIGDVSIGEREIDAQVWSNTHYVDLIMMGDTAIFGYNFVDGRLKGYPKYSPRDGTPNVFYFRMVRGNPNYGINDFSDNGDGTVTDHATGLMWQQSDDGNRYDWENALDYAEDLSLAGHTDWRLPNAKELHSIVDYTRSPGTTFSPAIDPVFSCTSITDPDGYTGQYGYYWSSSPLQDGPNPYSDAVYFCFGRAQGMMERPPNSGNYSILDVHGAGAQRNDPKTGNPLDYPDYFGPQGDVRYVFNFVRCVRDIGLSSLIPETHPEINVNIYPNPSKSVITVALGDNHKDVKIEIIDSFGRTIKSINQKNTSHLNIDTSTFSSGVNYLKLNTEKLNAFQKFIVE
jgi:hypothetical protein